MSKKWYIIGGLLLAYFLLRKPLTELYMKRQLGLQAVQDAAEMTGYTTYNTQIYSGPIWQKVLRYFKPSPYVPLNGDASKKEVLNYSMQG